MELEHTIRKYLAENLLYLDDNFEFNNDSSFIGEGLIDSMGVMELVAYVQSAFGIAVEQHEVTPENFDSVNKLAAFIRRKLGLAADGAGDRDDYAGAEQVREKQVSTTR